MRAVKYDSVYQTQAGRERIIPYCARKLAEETPNYECLRACFSGAVVLVPMPRKAPLVPGGLWPSLKLCQAIQRQGLAQQVIPLLLRTKAIRKSATSSKGERPSPEEHFATLAVEENRPLLATGCHFIIVDDFITRGSTMLAAYTRLREAFPNSMISSFALVRTMSDVELNSIVAPVDGVITYKNGFLHREP